jgi:DNA-binding GntR family transcriptional regulator
MGEARLAVERLAVRQAAAQVRADQSLIMPLNMIVTKMAIANRAPVDQMQINLLDIEFHTAIYTLAGNDFLQMLWNAMAQHIFISFAVDQSFYRLNPAENLIQHEHLRDLLLEGTDEQLDREIQAHIMSYGRGSQTPLATERVPRIRQL